MKRTASIRLAMTPQQALAFAAVRAAYMDACNWLVPVVREHRCWNRVSLHRLAYSRLRSNSALGSQMVCNAIFSVCKAYQARKAVGGISKEQPVPAIHFRGRSVHYDKRTYRLKGYKVSLYTLAGRTTVVLIPGRHQRRLVQCGKPKEADLVFRDGQWFFNVVIESDDQETLASGPVLGVDVGENTLAAASTGKVFGGKHLREERDRYLALRRRLQSNGSPSAKQRLRQVSGRERRHVKHINHETSRAIVREAQHIGARCIAMENLTGIRAAIQGGKRVRGRLHRWAFRQLQSFVEYKACASGLNVVYLDPAYSSQACCGCAAIGKRQKHRFECSHCGLRAHSDVNAGRNLARVAALIPIDAVRPSRISGDCRRKSVDVMNVEDARPPGTIRQPVMPDMEIR